MTMGTHIQAFFPHAVAVSMESIETVLHETTRRLESDFAAIHERGHFSTDDSGVWGLYADSKVIGGEGPSGMGIEFYAAVALGKSVERFATIASGDFGIAAPLRRVFTEWSIAFGGNGELAVAAGGMGDTDRAADLALEGACFSEVCRCLQLTLGPPAETWDEAVASGWVLIR